MVTYDKLEKERIEKIKNLNLDEVKAYIDNLNQKLFNSFEANNPENVDYYSKKLSEVIDLTSDKWINLDFYSMGRKLDITTSRMIENNARKHILYASSISKDLINADIILQEIYLHLDYILMIYYHNYYLREASIVEDLLLHLEFEYNFKDEKFNEYANNRADKYNEVLMMELNSLISRMKDLINHVIYFTEINLSGIDENFILSTLKDIEYEKEYVNKNYSSNEGIKTLKDGEYLKLLCVMKEVFEGLQDHLQSYHETKEKVLNYINSDDGFIDFKLEDYEFSNKGERQSFFSKEDFIAMRPSYDMKNCEFKESSYFDNLGDDDE